MASRITEPTWEATLPYEWESQRDGDYICLYHPNGVGAVQISAAFKDSAVTKEDLRNFASEHLGAGAKIRELTCGDFCGFTLAFGNKDTYWRHWYLRCANQMLFITYNCYINDRGLEDEALSEVLNSLQRRQTKSPQSP